MRRDWLPLSAASLVTGVMVLVLVQLLNPTGQGAGAVEMLGLVSVAPGRWLASGVLLALGSALLVLGLPSVISLFGRPLFGRRRGRAPAVAGAAVFAIGCVGVAGLATATLMFRSLALALPDGPGRAAGGLPLTRLVTVVVTDPPVVTSAAFTVSCLLGGILLIAVGLSRSHAIAGWVPAALLCSVSLQMLDAVHPPGPGLTQVLVIAPLVLLALAFTGVATTATAAARPDSPGYA